MKKLFIILFIVFTAFTSNAQIAKIFADQFPDSAKVCVGIISDYDLNSNAITNAFTEKFYTGGYINSDLKNSVVSRLKNTNRIGGNTNASVYVSYKLGTSANPKNMSIFLSVRDREHFDSQFSKDLYKVGFFGNADYAGKTANFNNFNLNFMRYQQIQVGVFSSKLDSAARWGVSLSFLKGEQYLTMKAKNAELFTSADGQYININTQLTAARSDTAHKGIGAFNGYGASLDLFFEAPYQTPIGNSKLCASVSDLGTIRFNDQTLNVKQDSLFYYSGFKINSIYDLQDSTLGSRTKDSIKNAIAPTQKHRYSATLPAVFNLHNETELNKHFHLTEGIRYVFNANYKLLFYVTGDFYINPKFIVSTTFGYGGYGTINCGLGIYAKLGKNFIVHAGSNNIEGYIAPKKTTGQGVYISLIAKFK